MKKILVKNLACCKNKTASNLVVRTNTIKRGITKNIDQNINIKTQEKWTPKRTKQQNFLDLDYVADINKTIQLWMGYISKQLIDNKIVLTETPGYIERTLIGTVKLWLQILSDERTLIGTVKL